MQRLLALPLCLFTATQAIAAEPMFDVHVHLRDGETSLQQYRDDVRAAGLDLSGIGVMWFGGPHQARQGDLDKIRAGNDRVIALVATHPDVLPIATVHPYGGDAALAELARVAAAGVKVLKIHAHTQGFDVADPRVETLAHRAGEFPVEAEFLWTLRNVSLDHVLLGSDYPQIGLGVTAKALDHPDLSAGEKNKIRSGNAMKLFGR